MNFTNCEDDLVAGAVDDLDDLFFFDEFMALSESDE